MSLTRISGRAIALAIALGAAGAAWAQSEETIRDAYPELAGLFSAFDVTQAAALDAIA